MSQERQERDYSYPPPTYPSLPAELVGMTCGAKTRAGTPCKRTDIFSNGRCKFHGGLSSEGERRAWLIYRNITEDKRRRPSAEASSSTPAWALPRNHN